MGPSAGALVVDCAAIAAIATGIVYISRTRIPASTENTSVPGGEDSISAAAETSPPVVTALDEGIVGLASLSSNTERATKFRGSGSPRNALDRATAVSDSTAEVFVDAAARRLEELGWAMAALGDLGTVSAVIFDKQRCVVCAEGALVRSDMEEGADVGPFVQLALKGGAAEVLDVDDVSDVPFLADDVRAVAIYPLGEGGDAGALVIASAEENFFGELEQRFAFAIAARLAPFVNPGQDSVA